MVDFGSRMAAIRSAAVISLGWLRTNSPVKARPTVRAPCSSSSTCAGRQCRCRCTPAWTTASLSRPSTRWRQRRAPLPEIVDTLHMTSNATPPVVGSVLTSTSGRNWLIAGGATLCLPVAAQQVPPYRYSTNQATYTIAVAESGGKEITCTRRRQPLQARARQQPANPVVVP